MKRFMRVSIIGLTMAAMIIGTLFTGNIQVYAANSKTTKTTSASKSTYDVENIELLMAASEIMLSKSFGKNYSVSRKDNLVIINVWQDGMAAGVVGVQAGLVDKKEWTDMTKSIQSFAETIYEQFEPYGANVNVNVLNDMNTDNTLLTYLNGVKFYDILDQ